MAEGTVRIVRDESQKPVGQAGVHDISDSDIIITTSRANRNSTSKPTTNSRRNSATQRAALSVEDRGNEDQEVADSNKRTPAPNKPEKPTGRRVASRPIFMSATEAKQNAEYLVAALEMIGVVTAGPTGEMTPFERGILIPPTTRMLERSPIQIVGKFTPLIDGAAIIIGMGMYIARVTSGVRGTPKNPANQVQEDTAAPIAAQPTSTVSNVRAGDIDGIAPPVPNQIRDILNGAI
jgi:hypothetical protein